MSDSGDEFAEFDMPEDEFDRAFSEGEPVEIVTLPAWLTERPPRLYRLVTQPPATYAGSQMIIASTAFPVEAEVNTTAVVQREPVRS
ncbi:MAG TPA: hypothetical protein VII16_08520 [Actinomycetes bacterium]|jgi:hypothetical protein